MAMEWRVLQWMQEAHPQLLAVPWNRGASLLGWKRDGWQVGLQETCGQRPRTKRVRVIVMQFQRAGSWGDSVPLSAFLAFSCMS